MIERIRALFLGDIFGQPGCRAVYVGLGSMIKNLKADVVIANGENAADGFGMTPDILDKLYSSGVDVVTSGNHIWQNSDILSRLDSQETILRPANYPQGTPGHGNCTVVVKGIPVTVINVQGRYRMPAIDCPFRTSREILRRVSTSAKVKIVDFHAEEPEEKEALAMHLDGTASAVFGTHTHVQTADERILPGGTAYITDAGMTGPVSGVIGGNPEISIRRALTQLPLKMEVADSSSILCGVLVEVDTETGKAVEIERVREELAV